MLESSVQALPLTPIWGMGAGRIDKLDYIICIQALLNNSAVFTKKKAKFLQFASLKP